MASRFVKLCAIVCALSTFALCLTPEQRHKNTESFEYVWKTIRDKHWQKDPAGLNWQAVHEELRPRIEQAQTTEAARAIMSEMLKRLHQSHFAIIPGDLYSEVDGSRSADGETTGMDVRVIGSAAIVSSVDTGSPAASAGVRTGWQIQKIAGVDLTSILEKAERAYEQSTLRELMLRRGVLNRLAGNQGEALKVQFLDGSGRTQDKQINQGQPKGVLTKLGYLWPTYVWIETTRIRNSGYVKLNYFLDPTRLMSEFGKAVEGCFECNGFIIDVRGNPGGLGAMAMGMAGWFVNKPDQRLGTLYMRDATIKFVVYPRAQTFNGPVAILVDGTSASTSEIFAEGMKDLGRARIFGSRSAAAALPSVIELLPNGDGFQYAIANYISEGGKPLEGLGVTPDENAPLTREALLAGKDPALDLALQWIERQTEDGAH